MKRARDTVSEKIDHLFRTIRRHDNREYTYDDVERGTNGKVSRSYVWKLRHGRNRNPSLDVIESMSEFFQVPPAYFFEPGDAAEGRAGELAAAAALLQDASARLVSEKVRGLSPTSMEAVNSLIDNLHAIEASRGRGAAQRNGHAAESDAPARQS